MAKTLDQLAVKLDRAKQHIAELDKVVGDFLFSNPYQISVKENFHTRKREWTLNSAEDIPLSVSAIAGDAIQNIRSILDHLVQQLIIANGKTPHPTLAGFPICESLEEYTTPKVRRKIEGVSQVAEKAIDALKPYKGGNDDLWRLHRLNNIDKHRLLLSAASALVFHDVLPSQRARMTETFFGSYPTATEPPDFTGVSMRPSDEHARFPLKVGEVFFSLPEAEMQQNFNFRLGVALNEPGIVTAEPIVQTLNRFQNLVSQILGVLGKLL